MRNSTKLAIAAGAMTVALPAVSAQAAVTRNVSLATPAAGNGSGTVTGKIDFIDQGDAVLELRLSDRCPADGAGVVLRLFYKNDNGVEVAEPGVNRYQGGCGDGTDLFGVKAGSGGRQISQITLRLCEQDGSSAPRDCVSQTYRR